MIFQICGLLEYIDPSTIAFAEKNFSKLKLINFYPPSTISEERLNRLTIVSI